MQERRRVAAPAVPCEIREILVVGTEIEEEARAKVRGRLSRRGRGRATRGGWIGRQRTTSIAAGQGTVQHASVVDGGWGEGGSEDRGSRA